MKLDEFRKKVIEKSTGIKIINVSEIDHRHYGVINYLNLVCIEFIYKKTPLYIYKTLNLQGEDNTKSIIKIIKKKIQQHQKMSNTIYTKQHKKIIIDDLGKIEKYKNAPFLMKCKVNNAGAGTFANYLKATISQYKKINPTATYEEVYLRCVQEINS